MIVMGTRGGLVVDSGEWEDAGYILMVESIGFTNRLIMRNKRKKGKKS